MGELETETIMVRDKCLSKDFGVSLIIGKRMFNIKTVEAMGKVERTKPESKRPRY